MLQAVNIKEEEKDNKIKVSNKAPSKFSIILYLKQNKINRSLRKPAIKLEFQD